MGLLGKIRKGIVEGAKLAFHRPSGIIKTADAGRKPYEDISDIKRKNHDAKPEKEYTSSPEMTINDLSEQLRKISEEISESRKIYDKKLQDAEYLRANISNEMLEVKENLSNQIQKLCDETDQIKKEYVLLQKKLNLGLTLIGVIGSIGIIIAIILSVAL